MLFKDVSSLELWWPFCSAELYHLCNFGTVFYEEKNRRKYYEFGPVVKEEMSFKVFFLSGALAALFSAEQKHLCNVGRGYKRNNSVKLF